MDKDIAQVAADCGLSSEHAAILADIVGDHKNGALEEIIGALYRRVEALQVVKATLERNLAHAGGLV